MSRLLGEVRIEQKFPTLNDIITGSKKHWSVYSRMKSECTGIVCMNVGKFSRTMKKVFLKLVWTEPKSSRRDPDNVMASVKFVLDGLVKAGVIEDDSKKYVSGVSATVEYEGSTHAVTIQLLEV